MFSRETPNSVKTTAIIVAMALAVLGVSTTQAAHAETTVVKARFAYAADAAPAVTYPQLQAAAHVACSRSGLAEHLSSRAIAACTRTMIDDGVAKIGSADLATLHALTTGRALPAYAANGRTG